MSEVTGGTPQAGETVVRSWHPGLATRLRQVLAGVALVAAGAVTGLGRLWPWQVAAGVLVLGAMLLAWAWLVCRSTRFSLTTLRIRREEGLLGRNSWETALRDVRNVTVRQSAMDRLFGLGAVEFTSAGGPYVDVRFYGIRDPQVVSELVWKLKQKNNLS